MMDEEMIYKVADTMNNILDQINAAEPGSKEQLQLVQMFETLYGTTDKEERTSFEIDKWHEDKKLTKEKAVEEVEERKKRRRIDIANIAVPAGISITGLVITLIAETTNVFTRMASKNWIGKVLNRMK